MRRLHRSANTRAVPATRRKLARRKCAGSRGRSGGSTHGATAGRVPTNSQRMSHNLYYVKFLGWLLESVVACRRVRPSHPSTPAFAGRLRSLSVCGSQSAVTDDPTSKRCRGVGLRAQDVQSPRAASHSRMPRGAPSDHCPAYPLVRAVRRATRRPSRPRATPDKARVRSSRATHRDTARPECR